MSDSKKTTPPTWSSPKDARQNKGAGKYPNYYSHKTRSGHVFMMDDSNGHEHVTLQHRGGSMIQFMPDGAIQFVSHNGQYNIVFGENRMLVTGAYDVAVQGSASLRVDGDYNIQVAGDTNLNIDGDFNLTATNMNQSIFGNIDTIAKNRTEKVEGSITQQSLGSTTTLADSGMTIASGDAMAVIGTTQLALAANKAELMLKSGGKMSMLSKSGLAMRADGGKLSLTSSDNISSDADNQIKLQSGDAEAPDDARTKLQLKPAQQAK